MKSKVYLVSDLEFMEIVSNSTTYSECLRKLGLSTNGGSSTDVLKRRIKELNCSIKHFKRTVNLGGKKIIPLEEILVEDSNYANISRLKTRLIREKLIEYKCDKCGNTGEWQGKPLSLQLDHINGNNRDHRLENLRLLCPNCHSQTETYSGKNSKCPHKA